eukprot:gb/GECH01014865.1/.p1 GENE.gb/GECH01014865.1/~~gb/GECH01014865.1/.p1  ORF type:complete len:622 (+),score=104.50 gb/GECH01014865.1/:1-1866(+)
MKIKLIILYFLQLFLLTNKIKGNSSELKIEDYTTTQDKFNPDHEYNDHFLQESHFNSSGEYYPIDWIQVKSEALPQTQNKSFGNCLCDLTKGACDLNCCCDTECSQQSIQSFSFCLPERENPILRYKCGNASPEYRSVLCVVWENSPYRGTFYEPISKLDSTNFDEAVSQTENNVDHSLNYANSENISQNSVYELDYLIPTAFNTSNGPIRRFGGFFRIPKMVVSGFCSDFAKAQFGRSSEGSCYRSWGTDPSKTCETSLNIDYYLRNVFLGSRGDLRERSIGLSEYVPISASSIKKYNQDNSEFNELTELPSTEFDSISSSCENAIQRVRYIVRYESGRIISASADVTIKDVDMDSNKFLEQEFSLDFIEGNGEYRLRSGNPGYISGLPVLGGVLVENEGEQAIAESKSGLTVPSGFQCFSNSKTPITFRDEMIAGCSVTLSLSELRDVCQNGNGLRDEFLRNATDITHVGIYGNANSNNINEWVEIIDDEEPEPIWMNEDQNCHNLAVGYNYKIVYQKTGPEDNPQYAIIGVRREVISSDWTFRDEYGDTSTRFWIEWRAQFVNIDANTEELIEDAPTFLPELKEDIFYPFTMSSMATSSNQSTVYILVFVVSYVLVFC